MFTQEDEFGDMTNSRGPNNLPQLISDNAPLKHILDCPYFPDELAIQRQYLIDYLKPKELLHVLLSYMIRPDEVHVVPQSPECRYAFYAYSVFSTPNFSITETMLKNSDLLVLLFSLAEKDENKYSTAQGYLMGIMKMLLSDMNVLKDDLITVLFKNSGTLIFPLIHNMTSANASILKEILANQNPLLKKLQFSIFEYILFFYLNEKFTTSTQAILNEHMFDNLVSIFRHLAAEGIRYDYKLKYEGNLYSAKNIRAKEYLDDLFYLRVNLLKYIANTGQIKKCDRTTELLACHKLYRQGKRGLVIAKEIVAFLRILSANEEFRGNVSEQLIAELILVLKNFPKIDVIHSHVFEIFMTNIKVIEGNPASLKTLLQFFSESIHHSAMPGHSKKHVNSCSLAFFANFIDQLDLTGVTDQPVLQHVSQIKAMFGETFTKFVIEKNDNISSVDKSDLMIILKNPLDIFKFSESLNDKKKPFLEIMPMITPELIKSRESLSNSMILAENALNNKDLLETEVIQLKNSFLNSAINLNTEEDINSLIDESPVRGAGPGTPGQPGLLGHGMAEELFSPDGSFNEDQDRQMNLSKYNMLLLSSPFNNA
jgi:hypothetical protein